jgi:chitin disaccharide deacetylase
MSHDSPASRFLIVNADDFGFGPGVNAGIAAAHTTGILTSTTLMANGDAFDDAVARARDLPDLGIGCHLVLLGGYPVAPASDVRSLLAPDGTFSNDFGGFLRRLIAGQLKQSEIVVEFRAQVEKILNAGIKLTHFDSHKHSHAHPLVLEAALKVAGEFGIGCIRKPYEKLGFTSFAGLDGGGKKTFVKQKLSAVVLERYAGPFARRMRASAIRTPDHFFGFAHTGLLNPRFLCYLLKRLPIGTSELMCHPAQLDASLNGAPTRLKESRVRELAALTAPEVRAEIDRLGVRLVNFNALGEKGSGVRNQGSGRCAT